MFFAGGKNIRKTCYFLGINMLCMRRTKTTNPFIVFLVVVNGEQLMMLSVVDISVFVAFV